MGENLLDAFVRQGIGLLYDEDPDLYNALDREYRRQTSSLVMVAAASTADPSVLICEGLVAGNTTTEGYPGSRFHAGAAVIDDIECMAIERARSAFKAQYANVQPHSGTTANQIVMFSLLKPGDRILGLELDSGGHLTHGARASVSGQWFEAIGYRVGADGYLDYDEVRRLARQVRPKLIISGASAYPRVIDFELFRRIADEVGAYLLADISHIAGLVVAGVHPSPIDWAHFTTTSTYKQLFGPRGGLILIGRDSSAGAPDGRTNLAELIQKGVFPFFQGTPNLSALAAKARALAFIQGPHFKSMAQRIVANARVLAGCLAERGYRLLTGGTDNHMILIDISSRGLTGLIAERALEECGMIVNKNRIPGDQKPASITSGLRIGTNSLALRGMGPEEMPLCAELIDQVLSSVEPLGDRDFRLDETKKMSVRSGVESACEQFPIPRYPLISETFVEPLSLQAVMSKDEVSS